MNATPAAAAVPADLPVSAVHFRHVEADGVKVFYREAGDLSRPTLLLLHGFPSSSHMYRRLIDELKSQFHLVAPDLPGFGFTEVPAERGYVYTFDNLARTVEAFVDAIGLKRYALYVFDYGAPVGLRLALARPQQVTGLVSQNGNAYLDGLGEQAWAPVRRYWENPTPENRDGLRGLLTLEGTRWQYEHGVADNSLVAPEAYMLDYLLLQRPGNAELQLDLFLDYANNVALYPKFQAFFRERALPTLAIWGKNDPFFIPPGAEAYRRDNPDAVVEFVDSGHFALETHAPHIARRIAEVLGPVID
ncbi:alpha/beta hydrolase [Sorangium sp. So ce134]